MFAALLLGAVGYLWPVPKLLVHLHLIPLLVCFGAQDGAAGVGIA